ncbi:MAG: hypothetical protein IH950_07370 [Bacteroidetes bacterium]|nr:hypothetical protein [Bacteroidota bacterium]
MRSSFNLIKFLGIAFIFCFAFNSVLHSQNKHRYVFKSAHIIKISKTVTSGIEITARDSIFIDDYGDKQVTFSIQIQNITMANMVTEKKTVSIIDGEWIINYDPETKEGTKMKFNLADKFSGMSEEDMKKFAEQMAYATGTETKDIGTKEIAGKTCKGTEATTNMMGMETNSIIWQYGNFAMEMVTKGAGTNIKEGVTKFEEGIKVDPKLFLVPDDVKITEYESPY